MRKGPWTFAAVIAALLAPAVVGACRTSPSEGNAGDASPVEVVESVEAAAGPLTAELVAGTDTVRLGDPIPFEFTLRNTTDDRTFRVTELVHDVQSVSLEVEWGDDVRFEFSRTTLWGSSPREWEVTDIPPGGSLEAGITMDAVRAGRVRITGVYRGAGDEGLPEIRTPTIEVTVETDHPDDEVVSVFVTNFGSITFGFFPDDAPNTVLNLVGLIRKRFFDDVIFHRVIPGFVIQGGDPEGTGSGGPGFTMKGEFNDRKHVAGILSMARTEDPDSAGSQFFICLGPAPHLDGQYTVFGEVIGGFDEVVRKIEAVELFEGTTRPSEDVYIEKAVIEVQRRS
jgi:cyclophilin family peptidyl-prolyl cis-trans isomerase